MNITSTCFRFGMVLFGVCFLLDSAARAECPDSSRLVRALLTENVSPGGYDPVWDPDEFWHRARQLGRAPLKDHPLELGLFVYFEENSDDPKTPRPFRTGHELELYRQIKEFVRTRHKAEMLSPQQIADLALYAVRDGQGKANAQLALLTAHNVMRVLARPKHWIEPGKPVRNNDPLRFIVDDLAGTAVAGGEKTLPQLMVETGRMVLSPSQLPGGVAKPSGGAAWATALFNPGAENQLFATQPGTYDDISNGGAHYYHWVGALAQSVGGWPGSKGAITFEAFIKRQIGEPPQVIEARRPSYEAGVALAQGLWQYSAEPTRQLLKNLGDAETSRLGLHQSTWSLVVSKSGFYEDLSNNISNSRDFLDFVLELKKVGGIDGWPNQVAMLKLLSHKDNNRYQVLLERVAEELPALKGKALGELEVQEVIRLEKFLIEHIKFLIGPRTQLNCSISFQPTPANLADVPIEGHIAIASEGRSVDLAGKRKLEISLDTVDELDAFIRAGAQLTLQTVKPEASNYAKTFNTTDFECVDGNLAAEVEFIVPYTQGAGTKARVTMRTVNLVNRSRTEPGRTQVRWEFATLFQEHSGVGVTFHTCHLEGWRGSTKKLDRQEPSSILVEASSSFVKPGGFIDYGPYGARDLRRGKLKRTFYGTDDNGNEISVSDTIHK